LKHTVLWVSQILIRHQGSDRRAPLTRVKWQPEPEPPARTRADAQVLATELALRAGQWPDQFAELAQTYSEDVTTLRTGGSLGAIPALRFFFFPAILDALSSLQPGQVSKVLETSAGFHVIRRRVRPPLARVSGAHLVIGYDDAKVLRAYGGKPPARTRAQALEVAADLYSQLEQAPDRFAEFVGRYSDHPDKSRFGDLGNWSTWEWSIFGRELEVLSQTEVGAIVPPLDSQFGVEILRRTPNSVRTEYAAQTIRYHFNPDDEHAKQGALGLARDMSEALKRSPEDFDELRRVNGFWDTERWSEGRDEPGLTEAVTPLQFGQITDEPVPQYDSFAIAKRVDPAQLPPEPEMQFDVPKPQAPDLVGVVAQDPGREIEPEFRAVAEQARTDLGLTEEEERSLVALSQPFPLLLQPQERITALQELLSKAERLLGSEKFAAYRRLLDVHFEAYIMGVEQVD